MPSSRRSPSPQVAALRAAAEGSCKQLRGQVRDQALLIRSGAAGELTEAEVERMADDITAAARARLDAAAPDRSPSADPELQAARREAAIIVAAAARESRAVLRKAWLAQREEAAGRRRRR
jgi:hypothetical protein